MNTKQNRQLAISVVIIYAFLQLVITFTVLAVVWDARNARAASTRQRNEIICILKIHPEDRTEKLVEACK